MVNKNYIRKKNCNECLKIETDDHIKCEKNKSGHEGARLLVSGLQFNITLQTHENKIPNVFFKGTNNGLTC